MRRSEIAIVAGLLLLLVAVVQLQATRERAYPPGEYTAETLYLQSGTTVRRLAGPLPGLAADLYWIRAIQHYGGTKRRLQAAMPIPEPPAMIASPTSSEYALLYPLLDITTTLDPQFKIAYRFGAVFLAEPYPRGPGRPDLAQALLEKGLRAQPDKWEYMQDIGFVHYWYRHDYRTAGEWFKKAGEVPGAPWWLQSLAATTLARGGDRRSSRMVWEALRQSAEVDWLRQDAERRLAQLQALDAIDALQALVDDFTRRHGAPPADWAAVAGDSRGRLRGVPLDAARVPYELAAGRVGLSPRSPLWPLPDEPHTGGPAAP